MNKEEARHKVEQKLIQLYTLKEYDGLQAKARGWKLKANAKEINAPSDKDFRTQISLIVKLQKDADLLPAIPEYDFIPQDTDGEINHKIVGKVWDNWWLETNTDKVLSGIIKSATTFGTGILFEGIKEVYKKVKVPVITKEGEVYKMDFKEEDVCKYHGLFCEKIPFENFFINGTNIDNSTEAIVIRYFDKEQYISEKCNDNRYSSILEVKKTGEYYPFVRDNDGGRDIKDGIDRKNVICEIEYWNCATDEYIILANGIEIWNTPIPYKHKELPFALYIDNYAEDRIWGIGEFELLEQDERYKNELRTLYIRGVKSAIGIIIKDKLADIEENEIEFGIGEVIETSDINGLKQFAPTVPIQAIAEAELKIDNDIISKSGVDFRGLFLTQDESATRTASKAQSTKKRINLNMKDNGYDFFRRLGLLRMENIKFFHDNYDKRITIPGGNIDSNGVFNAEGGDAYGSITLKKGDFKGAFSVIPVTETMIGNNKARRRSDVIQYSQLVGNMVGVDKQPVIKPDELARLLTKEFDYDYEKLTQQSSETQSAKSILNNIDQKDQGMSDNPNHPSSPNFVAPDQRSGNTQQVNQLSGQASIPANMNNLE